MSNAKKILISLVTILCMFSPSRLWGDDILTRGDAVLNEVRVDGKLNTIIGAGADAGWDSTYAVLDSSYVNIPINLRDGLELLYFEVYTDKAITIYWGGENLHAVTNADTVRSYIPANASIFKDFKDLSHVRIIYTSGDDDTATVHTYLEAVQTN